jgi:hypothetical protein
MSKRNDILVSVNCVGKKFSAHLKKGMWYGLQELFRTALGFAAIQHELRDKEFEALHMTLALT